MPPGYEPLLAAVCAEPWNDLPRLVFADFLDDHGQRARAEFIRLQVAAARGGPDARACQSRADHLLYRHKWDRCEPQAMDGVLWRRHFRRGFITAADFAVDQSPAGLAAVVAATPIERLSVYVPGPRFGRQLAGSPHLAGVTRLDLGIAGDAEMELLAANSVVVRLERMQVVCGRGGGRSQPGQLTDVGIEALVRSPYLSRLRWLRLYYASLSPGGHAALVSRFGPQVMVVQRPA